MRTRALALLGAFAATVAMATVPAEAHEGDPNYRSAVTAIEPQPSGLQAEVINFDDSLHVSNTSDETLVVLGYRDEPYVRIEPNGEVAVNQRSPSFYLNQDRYAETAVPASADAEARPDWRTVNESGEYAWHDHRIHWMGEGTPPQVTDRSEPAAIFDWSVPVTLDGEKVAIEGELEWVGESAAEGSSSALPIALGSAGVLAIGLGGLVILRRRRGGDAPIGDSEAW